MCFKKVARQLTKEVNKKEKAEELELEKLKSSNRNLPSHDI